MGAGFGPPIGLVSRNLCPNCRDRICYSEQNLKMGISISWLKGEEVAFRLMKEAKGRPNNTYRVEPYLSESQIALSWHPTLGRLWSAEQTTNRGFRFKRNGSYPGLTGTSEIQQVVENAKRSTRGRSLLPDTQQIRCGPRSEAIPQSLTSANSPERARLCR